MGKEKHLKKIEGLFRISPIVHTSSIDRIVKNKNYAKQIIRNLVNKGKIKKLTKGYYTIHNEPSLSVFSFQPAYLGLQDALSIHNLWEQETIPVIITTRKVRQGIRNVMGTNVLIRRLNKKYFFAFEQHKIGDFYLPYSDIEKTIIDLIYFRENIAGIDLDKINNKKLSLYLKKYPKKFRNKVLSRIKNLKT